jgi:hypothetical protein
MSGGQPELARKLGADAVVAKPFRPHQLVRILETLPDRAETPAA